MLLNYNAPESEHEAKRVAKNELIFMSDICKNHELGSLLSINRKITNEGIKEEFRKISCLRFLRGTKNMVIRRLMNKISQRFLDQLRLASSKG